MPKNSHAGTPATPFCVVGSHIVDPATAWSLVPVTFIDHEPVYAPDSPAKVVCCAGHLSDVEGAP